MDTIITTSEINSHQINPKDKQKMKTNCPYCLKELTVGSLSNHINRYCPDSKIALAHKMKKLADKYELLKSKYMSL